MNEETGKYIFEKFYQGDTSYHKEGNGLGVIGLLSFRTGMVFFLEWTALWYLGFPFGLCGLILIILAYPIYLKKIKKNKAKYKEKILALSQELLVDNQE